MMVHALLDIIFKFSIKVIEFGLNSRDISRYLIKILREHLHAITRNTELLK